MRILQISCSYFPDKIGGTEVYVHNLSKELISLGFDIYVNYIDSFSDINMSSIRTRDYTFEGIPVFVIEKNIFYHHKTKDLYFNIDTYSKIHKVFKEYLKSIKPDIVHFHHFSPTDVIAQMLAAKQMRIPIILTYHTPMMTCGHTDMLYLGRRQCSGRIDYKRCLICTQTKYGIPLVLAWIWAGMPYAITKYLGRFISNLDLKSRFATWLQLPWFTRERIDRWQEGLNTVDHFVAVCKWVFDLLVNNNIPPEHISLCRQGVGQISTVLKRQGNNTLRLGYLGRIHPVKGVEVLLKALSLMPPHYQIEVYIYGSFQNGADRKYYDRLRRQSLNDKRIKWQGILSDRERFEALSKIDILVIPSRWLETGPLVLLESWAVGTPIIGVKSGGIAELITDGIGGLLFKPGDSGGLAQTITQIYKDRQLLLDLKNSIPAVRTMSDVARDMEILYQQLK